MYTVSDTFLWVGVLDGFTQTVIWVHCIPAADVSHQILWPWPALRLFHGMNETVNVVRWDRGPGGVVLGVARVGFSYTFSMTANCFSNLEGSRNYKTTFVGFPQKFTDCLWPFQPGWSWLRWSATSATYWLFQGEPSNALWWHFDCAVWSWEHSSGVEFAPKKQQLDGWRICHDQTIGNSGSSPAAKLKTEVHLITDLYSFDFLCIMPRCLSLRNLQENLTLQ